MRRRDSTLTTVLRCLDPGCLEEFGRADAKALLVDGSEAFWYQRPRSPRESVTWSGARPACPGCGQPFPEELLSAEQVLTVALVGPTLATKTHLTRWLRPSLESLGRPGGPPPDVLPSLGWTAALASGRTGAWNSVMKTTTPWIIESGVDTDLERTSDEHLWPFVLNPVDETGEVGARTAMVLLYDSPGDHFDRGRLVVEYSDLLVFLVPPEVFTAGPAKDKFDQVVLTQLDNAMRAHQASGHTGKRVPDLVFMLSKADQYGKGALPAFPADAYRPRLPHGPDHDLGAAIAAESTIVFRWLRRHQPAFVAELMTRIRGARPGTVWFTAVGGLGPEQAGHTYDIGPTTRTLDPVLIALGRAGLIDSQ